MGQQNGRACAGKRGLAHLLRPPWDGVSVSCLQHTPHSPFNLPPLSPHHCQPPSHWRWTGKPNFTISLHPTGTWAGRRAGWSQSPGLGHLRRGTVLAVHRMDHWVGTSVGLPCGPPWRSGVHHDIRAAIPRGVAAPGG